MLNPDFRDMLSAFADAGVEYLVVGAYALAAHGVPRATGDLDCWIRRTEGNAARTMRALEAFGAPTLDVTIEDLLKPDLVFQIRVEPRRIDILTSIDGVDFDEAWQHRIVARINEIDVPVIGLRELVENKRAVGRTRDLADIERLESEAEQRSREGEESNGRNPSRSSGRG
ncbi:MAG: hypothetical protein ACOC9H_00150 [Gemmatimonadota bacterium]